MIILASSINSENLKVSPSGRLSRKKQCRMTLRSDTCYSASLAVDARTRPKVAPPTPELTNLPARVETANSDSKIPEPSDPNIGFSEKFIDIRMKERQIYESKYEE